MAITTVIFDFDGVLSDYDVPVRLQSLAQMTGLSAEEVYARVWASGFEDAADSGEYETGEAYLAAFNARLNASLSAEDWVAARRNAMTHWPQMHALAEGLESRYCVALLTNNGPMTRACFAQLAPNTAKQFADTANFSYQFGTKKPDPKIYLALASRLGAKPGECVFIDDKARNIAGAQEAGLEAIHFTGQPDLEASLARLGISGEPQ